MVLVDNTGMSNADWEVLQRAYLAMLQDTDRMPRDGSVAFGMVQYVTLADGRQSGVVSVPLTVLDDKSALAVTDRIKAAPLYSPKVVGRTVAAMDAVTSELRDHGRQGAQSNVCGTATTLWSAGEIAAAGRLLDEQKIDRSSMLHITGDEGAPIADRSDRARPVPLSVLARGSGTALPTRSFGQLVSVIPDACLMTSVRLQGIEVNQVIQNWQNDVPLVQYKPTVVRVFIDSLSPAIIAAGGVLHGSRDGVPLSSSPLSPMNASGTVAIDADVANQLDRANVWSSLNFRLPTSWLSGDVELRFEAASELACGSAPPDAQDCAVDVTFEPAQTAEFTWASVPWRSITGSTREPTSAELVEQYYRAVDAFPVRTVDMDFWYLPEFDSTPDLDDVNNLLYFYWIFDQVLDGPWTWWTSDDRWYGVLDGSGGGLANSIGGEVSSGWLSGTGGTEDMGYARNRGPHELAHLVGAHHIVNAAQNGTVSAGGTSYSNGWCGEVADTAAPEYPFWQTNSSGQVQPILGSLGVDNSEVWGLTPRFLGDNDQLTVTDPYRVSPMMSYCSASDLSSQYRWPSTQTYEVLTEEFLGTGFSVSAARPTARPGKGVLVRGIMQIEEMSFSDRPVSADERALNASLTFTSVLGGLPVATSAYPRTGDYRLVFRNSRGKVIAQRSVDIVEPIFDPEEPGAADPTVRDVVFSTVVPNKVAAQARSIEVLGSAGERIGVQQLDKARPKVTSVDVATGVGPAKDRVQVTWTQRGEGTASVFYRSDPKAGWKPLALDVTGSSVEIPAAAVWGAPEGLFQVVVGSGLRVASAISKPVRLPNHEPVLDLESACASGVVLTGAQEFTCRALAYDTEDGDLSERIVWTLDGKQVATGPELYLMADELSEGSHLFAASVADMAKDRVSETVTLRVYRVQDWGSQTIR